MTCDDTELNLTLSPGPQLEEPLKSYNLYLLEYRCSEPNSNITIHGTITDPNFVNLQTNYNVMVEPPLSDGTECIVRGCYTDNSESNVNLFESGSNGGKHCTTGKIYLWTSVFIYLQTRLDVIEPFMFADVNALSYMHANCMPEV